MSLSEGLQSLMELSGEEEKNEQRPGFECTNLRSWFLVLGQNPVQGPGEQRNACMRAANRLDSGLIF